VVSGAVRRDRESTGLLAGKVAVVTGAGRGIGRQHALLLAREGADVMVNDLGGDGRGEGRDPSPARQVADEVVALGARAGVNGADVADWRAAEELVAQTVATFGRLDILVNNAGIIRQRVSYQMSEDEFDVVVNVVLKGTFAPSRFAAAYWREQHRATGQPVGACIVNTTSEAGLYGNVGHASYGSAKAGVAALTITMARELERFGVRVNAIAPAAATRLAALFVPTLVPDRDDRDDPMSPMHVSPLVAWLCSDRSAHVTGQVFAVSGRRIQLIDGWRPVSEIDSAGRGWGIDDIERRQAELFAGRDPGLPPFSSGFD
jgi:NAD(P)-dependent dehydrogenase (short-subunit alcohol dehydrogenase family)